MTLPLAEPPIFIMGAGRSGTTLLQSLLSAHSRITVTPETHFCSIWEEHAGAPVGSDAGDFEAGWRGTLASKRFADLGVTPERARSVLERGPERSARAALAALMAAYGEARGKPRVGEKTPGHWRHARTLLDWFPEARLIVTRRDPRAVAASKMKAPWAPQAMRFAGTASARLTRLHVVAEEARHWARLYDEVIPSLLRDPRATLVSYEDLVGDAEGVMRRVCAFLGEAFEPAMLADRSEQPAPAAGRVALDGAWRDWRERHHAASRRPVDTGSLGKWRADLSAREVAAMEAVAGEVMARCGYEPVSGRGARRAARRLAGAASALGAVEEAARGALRRGASPVGGLIRPNRDPPS